MHASDLRTTMAMHKKSVLMLIDLSFLKERKEGNYAATEARGKTVSFITAKACPLARGNMHEQHQPARQQL